VIAAGLDYDFLISCGISDEFGFDAEFVAQHGVAGASRTSGLQCAARRLRWSQVGIRRPNWPTCSSAFGAITLRQCSLCLQSESSIIAIHRDLNLKN
jgi:hypothetical protein